MAARVERHAADLTPQALANSLWALAALQRDSRESRSCADALGAAAAAAVPRMAPQEVSGAAPFARKRRAARTFFDLGLQIS